MRPVSFLQIMGNYNIMRGSDSNVGYLDWLTFSHKECQELHHILQQELG